jgi:hypothetical protein
VELSNFGRIHGVPILLTMQSLLRSRRVFSARADDK